MTSSSPSGASSILRPYWNPEQPPGSTATRRPACSAAPCSPMNSWTLVTAVGVRTIILVTLRPLWGLLVGLDGVMKWYPNASRSFRVGAGLSRYMGEGLGGQRGAGRGARAGGSRFPLGSSRFATDPADPRVAEGESAHP